MGTFDQGPGEDTQLDEDVYYELIEIADGHDLYLARENGESTRDFAQRLIEALTDKILNIDTDIERIEALMPDAVKDL
ncbi:hypothetical protein [Hyphomicrobium sp.]|uniref:hypothetical protein n=1 Tax=Hyphomicrobium sp. TaxID=82 RepID=UPI002E34EAB2|nr:hypothetical protein [Hyphomicrobium sp.]HEX2841387.1 hypothetical protein [Hyphomicrobium sp.]